jgi:hypothetical protein
MDDSTLKNDFGNEDMGTTPASLEGTTPTDDTTNTGDTEDATGTEDEPMDESGDDGSDY